MDYLLPCRGGNQRAYESSEGLRALQGRTQGLLWGNAEIEGIERETQRKVNRIRIKTTFV